MDVAKVRKGSIYTKTPHTEGTSSIPDEAYSIDFRRATNVDCHPVNPED